MHEMVKWPIARWFKARLSSVQNILEFHHLFYALCRDILLIGTVTYGIAVKRFAMPVQEANDLSYEYDGMWDARYGKCGRLLIKDGFSVLGMNMAMVRISIHSEMSLATFLLQYLTSPLSLHPRQYLLAHHWLAGNAYAHMHTYCDRARRTSSPDSQDSL
jgi:hypothetical protein